MSEETTRRKVAEEIRAFARTRHAVMLADRTEDRHSIMGAYLLAADLAETGLPPGSAQEVALRSARAGVDL
jgi:hypothetical protein